MRIVAIDPGDGSKKDPRGNGIAIFQGDTGELLQRERMTKEELFDFLSYSPHVNTFLVEQFTYRPGKTKGGSTMQTLRTIGAIEMAAHIHGIEVVYLSPEAKTMGVYLTGEKPPANHDLSHDVDAYNMGVWWFVGEGICEPPTKRELTP